MLFRTRSAGSALLIALCLVFTLGCKSDQEKFDSHVSRAEDYKEQKKFAEAYVELRSALQIFPNHTEINFLLAKNLHEMGNLGDALFYYEETLRLDPSNEDAALAVAALLLGEDIERAKQIVEDVIAANPKKSLAYIRKSEIALVEVDTAAALRWAHTATEMEPNEPFNHLYLGRVHRARIRKSQLLREEVEETLFEAAESAFKRCLELDPDRWGATFELSRVYSMWEGHEVEAEAAFRESFSRAIAENERASIRQVGIELLVFSVRTENAELERWTLEQSVSAMPDNLIIWNRYAVFEDKHDRSGEQIMTRLIDEQGENIAAHVLYAKYLRENGRPDDAISHLERTAEAGPDAPIALGALVDTHIRLKQHDEARPVLERMERDYPAHARTRLAGAQILFLDGKLEEVRTLLREVTTEIEDAAAWRLLALTEFHLGNLPAAREAIDQAMGILQPPTGNMLRLKAQILHASEDWLGTLTTLRELLVIQGLDQQDRLRLAQAFFESGRPEAGKRVLFKLLSDENPPVSAVLEFVTRFNDEHPKEARELVEKTAEVYPGNARLIYHLTQFDLADGNTDLALKRLDDVIENQEVVGPGIYAMRAHILASSGSLEKARADILKAFENRPNGPSVSKMLLEIYNALGELEQAIEIFEAAAKDGRLSSDNMHVLARLHVSNGLESRAKEILEELLSEDPNHAPAMNDLAYLLAKQGRDLDRALKLAQRARELLGDNSNSADTLGLVYLRKELYDAATQQFRTAIQGLGESGQSNPVYQFHLGQALRGKGDLRGAAKAFEAALAIDQPFSERPDAERELAEVKAEAASS